MAFKPRKHTHIEPLTIPFGDESLVVYYKPYALTFNEAQLLLAGDFEAKSNSEKLDVMLEYLLRFVEKADWEDENGNPLGFSREILSELPMNVLQTIFGAVSTAINGGNADESKNE